MKIIIIIKRVLDIILINILTFIFGFILYYYSFIEVEVFGAIIATGISISFGIRQHRIENDKIFKELFTEFNSKYDEKYNNYLNTISKTLKSKTKYKIPMTKAQLIKDYFNFCAEEFLWYKRGRIPKCVWTSWKDGMLFYLNLEPVKELLEGEEEQSNSYYGFFEEVVLKEVLNKENI